ncbi:MAG: hypothetical protein KIT72_14995 [Polyangiaceae bacterium]|nr:hypothetical protein [Polyangiaceae bacterium]MCW5791723.1 hypothetical protein [Polyangiaceae bacterium]
MYDITDIIALLFLIWNTVRKLDISKQKAEDFPQVPAADFQRWQRMELFAYSLGAYASFAKIALNLGWFYVAGRYQLAPLVVQGVGAALFVAWGVALIVSSLQGTRGRALRGDLGIVLKSRREQT